VSKIKPKITKPKEERSKENENENKAENIAH
jgi:hypothetical protein